MFIEERLNKIIDILKEEGRVYVKDLSERFDMSEPAIRKDLQRLEKEGKLKRTYGGAILERGKSESSSIQTRLIKNTSIKNTLIEKAFNEIKDEEVIFLDISSINYLLAKLIIERNKKVTLVTNMVEISALINDNVDTELLCIGGTYNKILGGVIGSTAIENISRYRADKAFIGSCGVNVHESTLSNFDLEEGNTKKAIMNHSKKVYALIENEKFNLDGSYNFAKLEDIDTIITEEKPDKGIIKILDESGINII